MIKKGSQFSRQNDQNVEQGNEPSSISSLPTLTTEEFDYFSRRFQNQTGICIQKNKILMIEVRLGARLRALNLTSFREYEQYLKRDVDGLELQQFINALTTNKTEFYREKCHFDYLKESLLLRKDPDTVYIWSAACSTGEEVYTLAILCEELRLQMPKFDYRILGSDIDTKCIQTCKNGIYDKGVLLNVKRRQQNTFFDPAGSSADPKFKVGSTLRRQVKFLLHNLIDYDDVIPINFNVIFLRNVLIYFSKETAEKIVNKIIRQLLPGGLLFVSLTESLSFMDANLIQVGESIYQKKR